MANRVRVADLEFSSQKDARAFFYDIRDKYWGSQEVIEQGDSFTRLKALYEDYYHATNWPMPGAPVSFRVKHIGRGQGGSGGTTQGFAVTFDNGEETEFSADKAIKAIAKK